MNDTHVTVVGNVVDSPRRVGLATGAVTNFRMASTARRYDPATQGFVDAGTFWVDVECWNALSGNVAASLSKGDPVIVQGTLTTHEWESENGRRSTPRVRAFAVGPNLAKGRSLFTRDLSRRAPGTTGAAEEPAPAGEEDAPGEGVRSAVEDLQPGRDYVVEGETLDRMDTDAPREPAHA